MTAPSPSARELDGRREEFARLETLDTGRPLSLSRAEIGGCATGLSVLRAAAEHVTPLVLSGTGRERGLVALDSYLTSKTVVVRVGPPPAAPTPPPTKEPRHDLPRHRHR